MFPKIAGCTGILRLLLLGLLLPSVLVLGQGSNTSMTTNSSTSTTANATTTQLPTTSGIASTMTTAGPTTAAMQSPTTTGAQSSTSATIGAMNQSSQYQSMPTSGSMTPMMSTSPMSNSTGTSMQNWTSMMIYCPSFTCNYSDCYTMYTSQNATPCAAGVCWCQLIRQMDMCYTVSCSAYCADSCVNASQTNCSVNCCNSTGCLNSSFASMMMTTTAMPTTTTTPATTMTTKPQTTPNGNKCHKGTCTGKDCYTGFQTAAVCSSSQPHCQLKKETVDTKEQWTAGCTTNCSGQTACKTATPPPCHLECCNATKTSCLWLNGTLNVPNFSTRGPQLHGELMAFLICLLTVTLLL